MQGVMPRWREMLSLGMICVLAVLSSGCGSESSQSEASVATPDSTLTKESAPQDPSLGSFQKKLLDQAFETATALPVFPHIKDRSKAQQNVVVACLELDQPQLALTYVDRIENWRRGMCYANIAYYYAQKDQPELAHKYIDIARKAADETEDWRKDRIRVRIAQTLTWLGEMEKAGEFEEGVVPAETGKVDSVKAMLGSAESYEEQKASLDEMIATGNFDLVNNALAAYTQLFNRFYKDAEKRDDAEMSIKASWKPLPIIIRFDIVLKLAGFALDNSDQAKALSLVNEADELLKQYNWPLEDRMPLVARLVEVRYRAGDEEKARAEADAIRETFAAEGDQIVDIWRAEALFPLAAAYHAMGDRETSLAVYRQAIDEAVKNPNSRPRAEDITDILCSLAKNDVEPDKALWARIEEVRAGLGDPW